jgi:hypothetical protein
MNIFEILHVLADLGSLTAAERDALHAAISAADPVTEFASVVVPVPEVHE